MSNVETIKYQGKDYATVPARLKEFRETNPRAAITTTPLYQEDGSLIFRAEIIQDKSDENSATATGHARYTAEEMKQRKAFEKLETVSIGRSLSVLGYLNDGQIASTEEMDEFENYKADKVFEALTALDEAETLDELKDVFFSLGKLMANPTVVNAKNARKVALSENTKVRN